MAPSKFVLLIFCISGAANVLYLILNSHVVSQGTVLSVKYSETKTNLQKEYTLDARRLNEANQQYGEASERVMSKNGETEENSDKMFAINPGSVCSGRNGSDKSTVELVVIVISGIRNFLRRMGIRNTWGSDVHERLTEVRLLFLVGRSSDAQFQPQIKKESELFGDILQVDLEDKYENLTNKSLAMLRWVLDYCSGARYVLKTDDDMYINLPYLLNEMRLLKIPKYFFCYVFKGAPPVRDKNSKWYTSVQEYKYSYFPKYCSGTAYAFSANITSELYKSSTQIKPLKMEDVYLTGILSQNLNIPLIHGEGFYFLKRKSTGCDYKNAISGHEVPVREMYVIHAQLQDTAIDCDTNINMAIAGDDSDIFQKWQQSDVT